jgi:VWFA-related protein
VLIGIGRQLQVLQAATTNPLAIVLKARSAAFQSAMAGLDATALAAQLQSIRHRMDDYCRQCSCGTRPGRGDCDSQLDSLKQSVDAEAERWTAPTRGLLEQFQNVVAELAKLPTGRTLILISDGFNIDPRREFYAAISAYVPNRPQFRVDDSRNEPGLREALKIATERNVTIYAVDSRVSAPPPAGSAGSMDASAGAQASAGSSILGTNRSVAPRQDAGGPKADPLAGGSPSMEELARATGGVYYRESGDLGKQLRSALAEGRTYYMLAYVPKNGARDGKFRAITVETSDKKLSIRAKPGYWAEGAAQ